jgi:hypothetical protein
MSGEYNWATLFLGEINTGTWPSRMWESQIREVKYGHETLGIRTRERLRWRRPASSCKLQALPLVREGAQHQQTRNCLKIIKKKKTFSRVPDECLTPGQLN